MARIGIDAGHGGRDGGAVGPSGLQEKAVTLEIALALGQLLGGMGHQVVFSRTDDHDVGLDQRSQIFNAAGVDLVVSIHLNSYSDPVPDYVSTWILAPGGRAEVAARYVQRELAAATGWPDGGVRTANFSILRKTNAPALLAEIGFISNPRQEKAMAGGPWRREAAEAVARGIGFYYGQELGEAEAPFADYRQVSPYARGAVVKAFRRGILVGDEKGLIRPLDGVTREQLMVILDRLGLLEGGD